MSQKRFGGSRSVTLTTAANERIDAVLAEKFGLRFKGLMQVPPEEIEPLLFPNCRSLHMYWMKSAIDVVWLDLDLEAGSATVLDVVSELPPRRNASAPKGLESAVRKRVAALELSPGMAASTGIRPGDALTVRVEPGTKG